MRYLLAFCFGLTAFAAEPVATYTRFCATCGIWGAETILSESGQFVVHGPTARAFPPLRREGEPPVVELGPELVAVTADRVKRAFLRELTASDSFQDKIHVVLLARARPEQPIALVSHVHSDGFQYQLGLPVYLESSRLVKALVQALLQEYSNRSGRRNAELPSWLVEGMTRQLLSSVIPAAILNRKPLTVERVGLDRLVGTREYFQTNVPLTIQELSFANLAAFSPAERLRYESSSHLLIYELLKLRGGPTLLSQFIQSLPQALNWQTAFYSSYHQYFRTPLDLEKWWMLSCIDATSRQSRSTWGAAASLERLESLLITPAEYRVSTNAIPQKRRLTLQEVITATDFGVHKDLLEQKLQQIFFLAVNFSPEVQPLAEAYQQAIESYIQKRSVGVYQPALKSDPEQRTQLLVKSTTKALDELDRAREEVRAGRIPKLPKAVKPAVGRQVLITRGASIK